MAKVATTPAPGRARFHRLLRWSQPLAIAALIEVGLALVHLPSLPHVALAVVLHLAAELAR